MSLTESVQSFRTAPDIDSEAQTSHPQLPVAGGDVPETVNRTVMSADTQDKISIDHHDEREERRFQATLTGEHNSDHVINTERGKRKKSVSTASLGTQEEAALEQADVIAALIDSLHNSELGSVREGSLHPSVYSIERLPRHGASDASSTPRSRRMSAYSTQSSKTPRFSKGSISSQAVSLSSRSASRQSSKKSSSSLGSPVIHRQSQQKGRSSEAPVVPPYVPSQTSEGPQGSKYPPPAKLAVILISLYISIFLVALDRTIIGPAIPEITNQFNSIADIGWYGSAYMLTSCGFILFYGQIYKVFPTKLVFLISILLFEVGSAICGAAPSSTVLIIGRAVSGVGSSGIYTGAVLIITQILPLHRRPKFLGLFGACFGIASVAGPLLGGAFTQSKATWRWCFYINLPLGGFSVAAVWVFCQLEEKQNTMSWKKTLLHLDPIGTLLFLPSIVCLLLALEWGAAEYEWSDPRIIALLLVFAVLLLLFIGWQYATRATTATITGRILFQRSIAFGALSQFVIGASMLTCALYIPIWFQAIKGVGAVQSGIRTIPLVLSVVVGSISSGIAVHRIGYYTPFMIAGSIFLATGAGLITTWNSSSMSGMWIGYQVIFGLGVGLTMQHPNLACQVVLPTKDIPTGTALLSLFQTLGGALFASVGQNTFLDKFIDGLHDIGVENPERFVKTGATALKDAIPKGFEVAVLRAYNTALTKGPFFAALIVACLAFPAALGMEWRSVKEGKPTTGQPIPPDEESANSKEGKPMPGQPTPPDEESTNSKKTRRSSSSIPWPRSINEKNTDSPLPPGSPGRRSTLRKSADYSRILVQKLNPDLRDDLRGPSRSMDMEATVSQRE